jgi:hypothetical protein
MTGVPDPKPEPESRAYAIVQTSRGTSLRTYALRGTEVLAYDDSEPDTKGSAITQLLRVLTRD